MPFDANKAESLRKSHGLTMAGAATRAGMATKHDWFALINRGRDVRISTLERVARALNVTPAELLTPSTTRTR